MGNYSQSKTSYLLLLLSITMIIIIIFMSYYTHHRFSILSGDAELINQVGIIRGSIQRASKLHLSGNKQKKEIVCKEVNRIFEKYLGPYGASLPRTLINSIYDLRETWNYLEKAMGESDEIKYVYLGASIEEISEIAWVKSNEIVFYSQYLAEEDHGSPFQFYIIILMNLITVFALIFTNFFLVRRKLEFESRYDPLTMTKNRRSFEFSVDSEMARFKRYGSGVSLILFDVDNFKKINDDFGHRAGDKVLREIGLVVSSAIRECDSLYRIGGEEFAIISQNSTELGAINLAESVRKKVESHVFDLPRAVTISLGVATSDLACDSDQLYQEADVAMYRAKNNGRNRSESYKVEGEFCTA